MQFNNNLSPLRDKGGTQAKDGTIRDLSPRLTPLMREFKITRSFRISMDKAFQITNQTYETFNNTLRKVQT